MEDESIYSSCRGCGSPCHTRNECPEYQQFCEDVKQQIYELDYYHQDFFDASYYPPSSYYQTAPNLSVQQQVHYLEMKCEFLKMKIKIEESISLLPEDIRSYWEEEVVEMNTTSNFSPDEEPRVECLVVDDENETIIVLPNPPSKLILLINKCGDEYLKTRISSVKSQHIRQAIMEGIHINIYFSLLVTIATPKCGEDVTEG
ncbi:hypothetical protein E3N88_04038 [Mikania micrantha]|uniref:Uncharacterized protein n=1 Tax=Mikania micrantha TaxID=192012 RepID=A0A5N6PW44_9ASTR|nr:hypothetical protein E3N88_04038 [Mikania micrantha]